MTGFVCSSEEITAVQKRPSEAQQAIIDAYRATYHLAFTYWPHGLHYLPMLGPVWLPPQEIAAEGEIEGVSFPDKPVGNGRAHTP